MMSRATLPGREAFYHPPEIVEIPLPIFDEIDRATTSSTLMSIFERNSDDQCVLQAVLRRLEELVKEREATIKSISRGRFYMDQLQGVSTISNKDLKVRVKQRMPKTGIKTDISTIPKYFFPSGYSKARKIVIITNEASDCTGAFSGIVDHPSRYLYYKKELSKQRLLFGLTLPLINQGHKDEICRVYTRGVKIKIIIPMNHLEGSDADIFIKLKESAVFNSAIGCAYAIGETRDTYLKIENGFRDIARFMLRQFIPTS